MILVIFLVIFLITVLCAGNYWREKSERLEYENFKLKQRIKQLESLIK